MVRQTARVLFFEIIGGILFLAVVAAALFAWRLSQGPVELTAFKADIEAALTDARDGRPVTLGSAALEWSPEARQIIVTAGQVVLYDRNGDRAGRARRATLVLDASSLLFGQAEILSTRLIDGQFSIVQVSDEVWEIAGEPLPPIPAGTLPQTPAEWVSLIERAVGAIMAGGQSALPSIKLEEVGINGFDIDVVLKDGTPLMEIADAEGVLRQSDGDLRLTLSGRGTQAGLPRGIAIDLFSRDRFSALFGEVAFAAWSVSDLAARIGLTPDRVRQLPADMAFAFEFQDAVGLTGFSAEVDAGQGEIAVAGQPIALDAIAGRLDYDPVTDVVALAVDRLETEAARGTFRLQLSDAVRPDAGQRRVRFTAPDLTVRVTPMFEGPFQFRNVELSGDADLTLHTLDVERLVASIDDASVTATGRIARVFDVADGEIPLSIDLEAGVDGPLDIDTVTRFWPVRLGRGARNFAVERIEAGTVTRAEATLTFRPDSLAQGHLRDTDLDVRFSATGARVRFLKDMPPVEDATGTGRLSGNGFSVALGAGRYGSWYLTSGAVVLPRFMPKGAIMDIQAAGTGSAPDMLNYVFQSQLNLEEQTGFDPDRISGTASATFSMQRPALDDVPLEDITFRAVAEVSNGGLDDLGAGFDLTRARARVDVDKSTVRVTGNGDVGPAPVSFAWHDGFDDGGAPSSLTASAVVTPDILNAFGMLGRPYIAGEIPVDIGARIEGDNIQTLDLDLDLSGARIDLAEIGWLKPSGDDARAILKYDFTGQTRIASADLQSDNAGVSGDIVLGPDGRLLSFALRRAFLEGRADVAGTIARTTDGGLALTLDGPFLDLSPIFADLGELGGEGTTAGGTPMTVMAEVERLRVGLGRDLTGALFQAQTDPEGLVFVRASGVTDEGDELDASYQRDGSGANVSLTGDDAGFLVSTLFGADIIEDGRIELTGRMEWDGSPSQLRLNISDARLRDAPIITQLLSLASLRGVLDTLGGEGVLFTEIEVPLQIAEGRYVVTGGRASGPALGLTLNGWIEPETQGIDMSGVLVPSFGMNSALGGIPIIGDLFVGRDGEGILSLTYFVRGTLDRAQVGVNPLSAVAPGVLRRLFENPADTEIPLPQEKAGGGG